MARQALDKTLRAALEKTVVKAREVAEQAATEAVMRLGIGDASAPTYLDDSEVQLRKKLRAHGRQLGDMLKPNGEQEIRWIVREIAYSHWHRMLFARFLEQNDLLMYDEHTPVTLAECAELAEDEGYGDAWEMAAVLAAKMLPQIFRPDSPVYSISLAINHVRTLENMISALVPETFQAQDSLGWVYQFWQNKRKEEVNKSEVKIGAKELSPVTQLFTEPYMVSFLLDNALGAWWANRRLTDNDKQTAKTELELRQRASINGVPLEYLRFVKDDRDQWTPAAGTFDQWPKHLSKLKTLDPCCGSGHFLVAAFLMIVPMRMEDEGIDAREAVDAVLKQNIHGLELDQRCVELAAFALALEAWRYPGAGGYRTLPELHLACSGLSVKAAKEEWKQLGLGKKNLTIALDWMHQTFEDAPVLGSLINPRKSNAAKIVQWEELEGALDQALNAEQDDEKKEAGIVAQGMAKTASMLADQYYWVITNVPYLSRGKQTQVLQNYCEKNYPYSKNDLATVFLDRCLELCCNGGTSSVVLPQNWLFLTTYKSFREKLLTNDTWNIVARLGPKGFQTPMWDFNVQLISISSGNKDRLSGILDSGANKSSLFFGLDVSKQKNAEEKSQEISLCTLKVVDQVKQLNNPDSIIKLEEKVGTGFMRDYAGCFQGLTTGDDPRYKRNYWEVTFHSSLVGKWTNLQGPCHGKGDFSGREFLVDKRIVTGEIKVGALRGREAWRKSGVSIDRVASLSPTLYKGDYFHSLVPTLIPKDEEQLLALWAFASSDALKLAARESNQSLSIDNGYFEKFEIDIDFWKQEGEKLYPNGLPLPYCNDPTQWLFHSHPCGSVIWSEETKWTAKGDLRIDGTVLQVAVARLLGYQWPSEKDPKMELAQEQREWVNACAELDSFVDDDGIVCLPAVRGEKSAVDRLEVLLQAAYGDAWSANVLNELLSSVKSKSLETWLREKFFEQHCKVFQQRPFIWQIWDGQPDGFSVLVNYHQFDQAGLNRLIYTYLDDWIRTQKQAAREGMDGADIRLKAAQDLKSKLESISEGEKGLDIFVRWKSLAEQPIGWNPDLNDGVRLNIRPFMKVGDVGKRDAGVLRAKPNIKWTKDRGTDVESAPWYNLGPDYGEKPGSRINDHYLTLEEKRAARAALPSS